MSGPEGNHRQTWPVSAPDLGAAAEVLIEWLEKRVGCRTVAAVGHRVVHGGPHSFSPGAGHCRADSRNCAGSVRSTSTTYRRRSP